MPAFEVRRPLQAIAAREGPVLVRAEERAHFVAVPDIELALLVLAIGIERGVVAAFRRLHLAREPRGGLGCAAGVKLGGPDEPDIGEKSQERPVVIEHFLEVGNGPVRIDAVAAESAAQLVVDATLAHAFERDERHVLLSLAQRNLEIGRMRELRRAAEAAERRVEVSAQVVEHRTHHFGRELAWLRCRARHRARECLQYLLVLRADVGAPLAPELGDALA